MVAANRRAWHGLGVDVGALDQDVFGFKVAQKPLIFNTPDGQRVVEGSMINVRVDERLQYEQLGVVSSNYKVVQPQEMADFAAALMDETSSKIKVEAAGSSRYGGRLWFLLKGDQFEIKNGDGVFPYICLINGYDGGTSFRVIPSSIRIYCSNMLHMVYKMAMAETRFRSSVISIRHTQNVMERIGEAREALKGYGKALESTKEIFATLAGKDVNTEQVQKFFLESYQADFGAIPENPKNGHEQRARQKASQAFQSFIERFENEKEIAGTTAWNMANSYSGFVQHDKWNLIKRKRITEARIEKRVESNLFGKNQERSLSGFERAYKFTMVG